MVALSGLFQAGLDLGRHRGRAWFLDQMRPETEALLAAIGEEFDLLSAPGPRAELLRAGRLDQAFATFEAKVNALRARGVLLVAPVDQALALAGPLAALQSLCDELKQLRRAMAGLPRMGQPSPLEAKRQREVLPALDWFWVRVAIKGGLTAVIAIVWLQWLNPPGSGSFPLMAWTLTIMGRPFLRAGGSGTCGGFRRPWSAHCCCSAARSCCCWSRLF